MKIRHISTRFALLLGIAAVLPLLAYGFVSLVFLQRGTRESVINGNQNVAIRAAEEIRRYVVTNAELLKALSADLQDTGLAGQQDQILKNYVLQFREFREITLFDESGETIASSRVGKPRITIPPYFAAVTVTRKRPWSGSSRTEILKFARGPSVAATPNVSSEGIAGRSSRPCGATL